jgi:hypothetical protein
LRYWSTVQQASSVTNGHASNDNARKELPAEFTGRVVEIVNGNTSANLLPNQTKSCANVGASIRVDYQGQPHLIAMSSLRTVLANRRRRRNQEDDNE